MSNAPKQFWLIQRPGGILRLEPNSTEGTAAAMRYAFQHATPLPVLVNLSEDIQPANHD